MTLDQRTPGQALAAIVPAPLPSAGQNLFGAKLGDTFAQRFDPARLHVRGPLSARDDQGQGVAS
ncbi:hypothetical protein [Streptomyces sp. NPDC056361]|uniref:hypothetical protein n=1 Tax=Streptomyces sp. NPDC056361 TaxID=3345795 RepID=UPI0035DA504D